MVDLGRVQLLFGPYRSPRFRVGRWVRCQVRGQVKIVGFSEAPIPWPLCKSGGWRVPVVYQGLARAVRRGILVVAAAGNDGCECPHVPAALPGVLRDPYAPAGALVGAGFVAGGLVLCLARPRNPIGFQLSSKIACSAGNSQVRIVGRPKRFKRSEPSGSMTVPWAPIQLAWRQPLAKSQRPVTR